MKKILFVISLITVISVNIICQSIPKQINYQGILKDGAGNLLTGDYALTFKIYNEPTGGAPLWTEIQVLSVTNGLFNTQLGKQTPISGVPFDRTHFLGIQVGTGAELAPRTMLTPSPYSFMSMNVIDNTVVKSLNGLRDDVNLVAGSNITITPSGNDLTISAGGSSGIIGGNGTINYIPLFTGTSILGNSKLLQDSNGDIQIGTDGARTQLTLTANDNQDEGAQINWNGAASYDDWYQDVYQNSMRLRSNSINNNTVEIFNSGTGKADLNVEGEIQRQPTGDANMVPIAYGTIWWSGQWWGSGTNNWSVTHVSPGVFEIELATHFYSDGDIVVCSVRSENPSFITYSWASGSKLKIKTWDNSGVLGDCYFSFVLYRN